MKKKMLVCGSAGNPHILKQLRVIKESQTDVAIDFLSLSFIKEKDIVDIHKYTDEVFIMKDLHIKISILKLLFQICGIFYLRTQLKRGYDCILVNAIDEKYLLIFDKLRRLANKLVLSPWGSEILRADSKSLHIIRRFYKKADVIPTGRHSRFERIIKEILDLDEEKLVNLPNGSKLIDMHIERQLKRSNAKGMLNFGSDFLITCGYNGYRTQNHLKIIEGLRKVKDNLPYNTHLVFPVTYGLSDDYRIEMEDALKEAKFKYTLITVFMPEERLFELQRATDIFIHLQTTDASSASVKEFIMAGSVVFNGVWLSYPEIELHGIPYITVNNYDDLGNKISLFFKGNVNFHVTNEMLDDIKSFSYSNFINNWNNALNAWLS